MNSYGLLDQAEEDALHASRLLNVEEKPFRRLTKRLLAPDSLLYTPVQLTEIPPADGSTIDDMAAAGEAKTTQLKEQLRQWQEDTHLDFTGFDSNIVRAQFLLNSNERERSRYAAEKVKILKTAQAVRDNNAQLREQLREAQATLALRKTYDELAERITSNKSLRPRDEQQVQIQMLNAEIAELERESSEYAKTWAARREQFGRIVEEGRQMLRLIRDEKEEAERKEGIEDAEDAADPGLHSSKSSRSGAGTPRSSSNIASPQSVKDDPFKDDPVHGVNEPTLLDLQKSAHHSPDSETLHKNGDTQEMVDTQMLEAVEASLDERHNALDKAEEADEHEAAADAVDWKHEAEHMEIT